MSKYSKEEDLEVIDLAPVEESPIRPRRNLLTFLQSLSRRERMFASVTAATIVAACVSLAYIHDRDTNSTQPITDNSPAPTAAQAQRDDIARNWLSLHGLADRGEVVTAGTDSLVTAVFERCDVNDTDPNSPSVTLIFETANIGSNDNYLVPFDEMDSPANQQHHIINLSQNNRYVDQACRQPGN